MTVDLFDTRPFRLNVHASVMPKAGLDAAVTLPAHVDTSMDGYLPGYPTPDQANALGKGGEKPIRPLGGWSKRLMDITIALVTLILASPIMLLIAVLIRVTAGGPVIFAHTRVGFNEKAFVCYKFRTMVANSEQALNDYLANNAQAAKEWSETRKLKHDPRITVLGQMLRKSSLDELPQLINILRGDMSCVGPRPIVTDELERYGPYVNDYLRARPGLTGLWQVTGRNDTDYSQRVLLDSRYVRNWSLQGDLIILARTAVAVMRFDQTS